MYKLMTLKEWEKLADRTAFKLHNYDNGLFIPDTIGLQDSGLRPLLWQLSDYVVSSVTGGTIWLSIRRVRPFSEVKEEWITKYGNREDI